MKYRVLRSTALTAMTLAAFTSAARAEEPVMLGTIVLTATGREQSLADVPASVEVIEGNALTATGALTLGQVMGQASGLLVRNTGANESISIRGQKDSGTLVLIDGQPRTGKYGSFNLNNFPIGEVERIEVVRGPMSALYGADAFGGVVNVITKRPGENPGKTVSLMLGARPDDGDRATFRLGTSVEVGDETFGQRFALDIQSTGGYSLPDTVRGEDFSGLKRLGLSWAGAWAPAEGQELRWRLEAYRQRDSREAFTTGGLGYDALEEEDRLSLDTSWSQDLGAGRLTVSGLLSYSDGIALRTWPTEEKTRATKARLQARYDITLGQHDLSFAAGTQHDSIEVTGYARKVSEDQLFALIQDDWLITDRIGLTIGARIDHFDGFGTTTNPRIVLGSRGEGLTWRVGVGRAFRAPGLSERFANITRGVTVIRGNPDLAPETSLSYEAAIGWADETRTVELVVHDSKVEDLISTQRVSPTVTEYLNVDEARIRGVELTGSWQVSDALHLSGGLEYLDARDERTDSRLTGRYRQAWHLASTWEQGDWAVTGRLRGMTGFWESDGLSTYGSGFTTVDLNVTWAMDEQSEIGFGVDNLFDRKMPANYSTARYREDAGRFAYISFNRRF